MRKVSRHHTGQDLPGDWERWRIPWGPSGQGLASRAGPTASARGEQPGAPGQPQPQHQGPPGTGSAKAGLGCGPTGVPGSEEPLARLGRAVGSWRLALLWLCWGRG